MARELRQFVVRPEIPGSPVMTAGGRAFMGLKPGDIVTIAGYYEPTRWERFKEWALTPFYWVRCRTYGVQFYFSNLWAAILGRSRWDD